MNRAELLEVGPPDDIDPDEWRVAVWMGMDDGQGFAALERLLTAMILERVPLAATSTPDGRAVISGQNLEAMNLLQRLREISLIGLNIASDEDE